MAVQNTETFTLIDITTELGGGESSLQECFDNAVAAGFDPTYNNDGYAPANSMLRFRNYVHSSGIAWDITTTQSLGGSTTVLTSSDRGVVFNPDGLSFYTVTSNTIKEWTLSTAWDITTTNATPSSYTLPNTVNPTSLYIGINGIDFFIGDNDNAGFTHHYRLSTAWDISSTISLFQIYNWGSVTSSAVLSTYVYDDGTNFMMGTNGSIFESSFNTAYKNLFYDRRLLVGLPQMWGHTWGDTGLKLYYTDNSQVPLQVKQRRYSTTCNLSTPTGDEESYTATGINEACKAIFFKPDGRRYYILTDGTIYQLNI